MTMDGLQAGGAAADGSSGPAPGGQDPSAQRPPPGPTPPVGRSWRHRLPNRSTRPGGPGHVGWPRRVVVLVAGMALLLTALVVAALPPLGRLADESARLRVAVSARGAIDEARTANAEAEAALAAMVAETAPAEQATLLGQGMERSQYAKSLIDKSGQPADPGTASLRARLGTDWTTATGLSGALASARIRNRSAPMPPGMVSAQFRADAAVSADLAALSQHYQQEVTDLAGQLNAETAHTRGRLLLVYGCGLGLLALLLIPGVRQARRWACQDRRRAAQATSADVEARVRRAYEMADGEADALAVTGRALTEVLPGHRSRLLLADSSHAHLTSMLDTAPDLPSCSPDTPDHCPAAARGQLCAFPDSSTLDACPRLPAGRGPVAASCAPISVAGRSVGVLQLTTTPTAARPARSEDTAATQQLIALRLGDRLSILRAFARSERQASTDPLTGLLNRRSLEDRVRATVADPAGYAVAYLDIDRFKQLNDTHGHAAGDRALRAFATTLRRRLRPRDLIGRWGGEEFLAVLPDCDRDQARTAMERLRADLLDTLAAGDTPGFTISCGIATSADAPTFADVVHRADQALLAAKAAGRDSVIDCTALS